MAEQSNKREFLKEKLARISYTEESLKENYDIDLNELLDDLDNVDDPDGNDAKIEEYYNKALEYSTSKLGHDEEAWTKFSYDFREYLYQIVAESQKQFTDTSVMENDELLQSEGYNYESVTTDGKPIKINPNLLKEYGNNFFQLTTFDMNTVKNSANTIKLAGVLKELPSFSMSTTWEKGPASSISDTVKEYLNSPTVEMVTTIGGHDRSWMALDEGTDKIYKASDRPSFQLTFKIFTNDNIGSTSLSSWKTWLKALSLYAMPSISTKYSINAMGNNIIKGIGGTLPLLNDAIQGFKDGFNGDNDDKTIINKVLDGVKGLVNNASDHVISRDGANRVVLNANAENFYGAKLWYLNILPGIFENPLIVYISSWGVTYSKEINIDTQEPIWIEFTMTCVMDQIASAPVWMRYLSSDASTKGIIKRSQALPAFAVDSTITDNRGGNNDIHPPAEEIKDPSPTEEKPVPDQKPETPAPAEPAKK
jgi:hypothetical protein